MVNSAGSGTQVKPLSGTNVEGLDDESGSMASLGENEDDNKPVVSSANDTIVEVSMASMEVDKKSPSKNAKSNLVLDSDKIG